MKIVALAGGVGGAKLVHGLSKVLPPEDLTVIVNTGDDFTHFGLKICPDIDTICYTLGEVANTSTGWGRDSETWNVIKELEKLGAPTWFRLGDKDIAYHMERTRLMSEGRTLSQIVEQVCSRWNIGIKVLPMTKEKVSTHVITDAGDDLAFQEYFVKLGCLPVVNEFRFEGIEVAEPAPGVIAALEAADFIVICPSNPWVSIDPILNVKGIRGALGSKKVLAVSPIVGGRAIKGPAAKMFTELGIEPSVTSVAKHYSSLLNYCVLDDIDRNFIETIEQWGIISFSTNTIMKSVEDRVQLAEFITDICSSVGE